MKKNLHAAIRRGLPQIAPYVAMVVAALPLLIWRDFTPDNELRYLSIADEAIADGNWFAFTNHGIAYADKPPLYLWLVMIARYAAGAHCMALLALFSLAPAMLTAFICSRWLGAALSPRWRAASTWMLLTSAFFFGLAVTLRMDMLMTLFIVLAMRSFHIIYTQPDSAARQRWLFPLWVFLAVFTKGPFGVLIPLVSTLVFCLWERCPSAWLQAWGVRTWCVLAALCALWFGAVWLEGGSAYLDNLLVHQTVDRAVNAFHHKRPVWYYAVAVWYVLAPWCLMEVASVAAGWRGMNSASRLCASVVIPTFVMLSLVSSKIQVYLLPIVPFVVYWSALALPRQEENVWVRVGLGVVAVLFGVSLPALMLFAPSVSSALGPMLAPLASGGVVVVIAASGLLTLSGLLAVIALLKRKMPGAIALIGGGLMAAVACLGLLMPQANEFLGYGEIARKAGALPQASEGIAAWHMPRGENMDVYVERSVEVLPDSIIPAIGSGVLICPGSYASEIYSAETVASAGTYSVLIAK